MIDSSFHSLEEEWRWIIQNKNPFEEWNRPPLWIRKTVFLNKKSDGTDRILKNFEDGANRLGAILHDDHWFDRIVGIIETKQRG